MKHGYSVGHVVAAFLVGILVGFLSFCIAEDALEKRMKARHHRSGGNSRQKKRTDAPRPAPKHGSGRTAAPYLHSGENDFFRNWPDSISGDKQQPRQSVPAFHEKEKQPVFDSGTAEQADAGISASSRPFVPLSASNPEPQQQKSVPLQKTREPVEPVCKKAVKSETAPEPLLESVIVSEKKPSAQTQTCSAVKSEPLDLSGFTQKLGLKYDDFLGTGPFLQEGKGYLLNPANGEVIPEQSEWNGILTLQNMARTGVLKLFSVEVNGEQWSDSVYRENSQLKNTTTCFQLQSVRQPAIVQDKYQTKLYTVERPGILVLMPI